MLITSKCIEEQRLIPKKIESLTLFQVGGARKGMRSEGLLAEQVPPCSGVSPANQKVLVSAPKQMCLGSGGPWDQPLRGGLSPHFQGGEPVMG